MSDSLFSTLTKLKGNQRACVYTEPLWGLSMNLCIPYLSVYMLAIGLKDTAENFLFFLTAAVLNGTNGVTTNAWRCLLVEGASARGNKK